MDITDEVIQSLKDKGINVIKAEYPIEHLVDTNEVVHKFELVSKLGYTVEQGIEYIVKSKPALVIIKDVIQNEGSVTFRLTILSF